jgi:endonuclease/exonuclease/phosphatase (EEP) superfamily protein YafD
VFSVERLVWLLTSLLVTGLVVGGGVLVHAPVEPERPLLSRDEAAPPPSVPVAPVPSGVPTGSSADVGAGSLWSRAEKTQAVARIRAAVEREERAAARAAAREQARREARAQARKEARQQARKEARQKERVRARRAARAAVLAAPLNVDIIHANIPNRSTEAGYRATLAVMVTRSPDFIGLNEQSGRSIEFIESVAPGYTAYRNPTPEPDPNSMGNVVLFKTGKFELVDAGRVRLVTDDHTVYKHKPVVWDRYATWVKFVRVADRVPLSVVSTHMMTNPGKYGPNMPARQAQYGRGMDTLINLIRTLNEFGPVLVAGDMNTHASQEHLGWAAASKMRAAGFDFVVNAVDFIFYPRGPRLVLVEQAVGPTPEPDHRWVYARFQ